MSSSEIDDEIERHQLAPMRKEILELQSKRVQLNKGLARLSQAIFHDGKGATRRINRLVSKKDAKAACDALDDKGLIRNRYSFGLPRTSWFDRNSKPRLERNIDELKTTLQHREAVDHQLSDKVAAYNELAAQAGWPPAPTDGGSGGGSGSPPAQAEGPPRPWFQSNRGSERQEENTQDPAHRPWPPDR